MLRRIQQRLRGRGQCAELVSEPHAPADGRDHRNAGRDSQIEAWLSAGYAAQQQGDGAAAERWYQQVLEVDPLRVDALHRLGRLHGQRGQYRKATDLLEQVLALRPDLSEASRDLGNVYRLQGRLEQAVACYRRAIALNADDASAHYNLGLTLFAAGEGEAAARSLRHAVAVRPEHVAARERLAHLYITSCDYERALTELKAIIRLEPARASAHYLIGVAYQRMARYQDALTALTQAASLEPNYVEAVHALGCVLLELNQYDDAAERLQTAVALKPDFAEAHYHLGLTWQAQGKYGEACDSFKLAIHHRPRYYEAHLALGDVFLAQRCFIQANQAFDTAIAIDASRSETYVRLGYTKSELGELEQAREYLQKAIDLAPDCAGAFNGLGVVLRGQGRYREAEDAFVKALALEPRYPAALSNLGAVYADQGQVTEAIATFDRALLTSPDDVDIRWSHTNLKLLVGDLAGGWRGYGTRWEKPSAVQRPFAFPVWDGSSLAKRTVLVYGEQGLGDEIMFASCLPDVIARAKHCVIECDERLAALFARSFPKATVHGGRRTDGTDWLREVEPVDVQAAMGDLPRFFRGSLSAFPKHSGYLEADAEKVRRWRHRLEALGTGVKVGLSWRGGRATTRTGLRSIALSEWGPVLQREGVHFVSLQYTACEEDLAALEHEQGVRVHHWGEAIADYDETAALVSALDLVVSVCTSVVSLGGALGRPVWVLVPSSPGWMFLREGERMPWFPSLRLFRQAEANVWGPVLAQVGEELGRLVAGRLRERTARDARAG